MAKRRQQKHHLQKAKKWFPNLTPSPLKTPVSILNCGIAEMPCVLLTCCVDEVIRLCLWNLRNVSEGESVGNWPPAKQNKTEASWHHAVMWEDMPGWILRKKTIKTGSDWKKKKDSSVTYKNLCFTFCLKANCTRHSWIWNTLCSLCKENLCPKLIFTHSCVFIQWPWNPVHEHLIQDQLQKAVLVESNHYRE